MKTKTNPQTTRTNNTRLTKRVSQRAPIYFAALFCFALAIVGPAEAKSRAAQAKSQPTQATQKANAQPQAAITAVRNEKLTLVQDDQVAGKATQGKSSSSATSDQPAPELVTAGTYPFASASGVVLEDMSSGTTTLVAANLDDNASSVTNIGFDFWYDGVRATQFSVNANGLCRLGSTAVTTSFDNGTDFPTVTNAPKIAPYYDDLWTGTNGKVHFKVVGSAPSRKLVVEWQNEQIPRVGSGSAGAGTFQMWLFESTGLIEFVYGSGIVVNSTNAGYTVGLQSGAATNIASVTTSGPTVSYAASNNTQTNAIVSGTAYVFTPNVPAAPTGLSFTSITPVGMTLNWTDNATNEFGYAIYQSTDNVNFSFVTQTAANATSQAVTGLTPSTTYFFQVYAVTEGALSTALSGSQATAASGNITSNGTGGGNWSSPATWSGGAVPTAGDNATIRDGDTVTIDTAAACINLTVGQGASGILQYDQVAIRTLTAANNVTIAAGGTFRSSAPGSTGTVTTNSLSIGGGLTNNGTLNFSTTAGAGGTTANAAGAQITFTGAADATFDCSATAAVTNLRSSTGVTLNKGTSSASNLNFTPPVTYTSAAGATSAGTTITVGSTTGLASGMFVSVTAGTGVFAVNTTVVSITNGTQFVVTTAPTTALSGGASVVTASKFAVQSASLLTGATAGFLSISNGTFKVGGSNTFNHPLFNATAYSIPATGGIWLNNANFTLTAHGASPTMSGLLRMTAGTYNVGTASGNAMSGATTSSFIIEGGTMNFSGRLQVTSASASFNMSAGTINVCTVGNTASASPTFGFTSATSLFTMSGGTINLVQATTTGATLQDYQVSSIANVTGGTLNVGTAATATTFIFRIQGQVPALVVDNTTNAKTATLTNTTIVYGNITVNTGASLNFNATTGFSLFFLGTSVTNNGSIVGTAASTRFDFQGTGAQSYSGAGTWGTAGVPFVGLGVGVANTNNVTLNSPIVTTRVNLFLGSFINSNQITLGSGAALAVLVQRGGGGGPSGSFDVAPIFNLGTGSYQVSYAAATTPVTTSVEIPATRALTFLVIGNSNGVTLAGGGLAVSGQFVLTLGNLITTSANLLTITGTATTAVSGGGTTSYVNGPLARTLPANLVSGSIYTFPVGKGSFNMLELVNPTTNAGGTVVAQGEVFDADSGGSAGTGLDTISHNRYWNATMTSGAANFTNTTVRLTEIPPSGVRVGQSATQGGSYNSIGGTVSGNTVLSSVTTSLDYFVMGQVVLNTGTYTVGAGGNYPDLPTAVADYNSKIITGGPVVFSLTDATYNLGAALTFGLNPGASATNTLTIKPAVGVSPVISGSIATALIDLNGAKFVIINGSNAVGAAPQPQLASRDLTVRNTNTAGATIRFINDASNDTVKNSNVEGAITTLTSGVVLFSTGVTTGNLNNTVDNNTIRDRSDAAGVPANLIYSAGTSAAIPNKNNVISNNDLNNFTATGMTSTSTGNDSWTISSNSIFESAARTTGLIGIVFNSQGTNTVTLNTVRDLNTSSTVSGMQFLNAFGTTVSRNRIFSIPSTSGSASALNGIRHNGGSALLTSVTIVNNQISIVPAFTNSQTITGIEDDGFTGNVLNVNYNSVLISGTASGSATWAYVRKTITPTTTTLNDNIFFNNRTGGSVNHFATGDESANTGGWSSNNNVFVGTGTTAANFMDYGSSSSGTAVSSTTWKAGPPARDAASQFSNPTGVYTVAGMFASASDLHLRRTSPGTLNPAENAGATAGGVTNDFDGDTRANPPDIGADEVTTMQFSAATYSVAENVGGGMVTITATRTAGSGNAATINYSTSDGSATGGASCGVATDYVNTSGTLNFAAGETSKTFNISICDDSAFENDETVNLALNTPTGGSIQGAPATAVLTITNDDPVPTISIDSVMVSEGGGNAVFTVTQSAASGLNTTFQYSTADVTATAGSDYTGATNAPGMITAGSTTTTISIPITDDGVYEGDETFTVTLSSPANATIATGTGTGTIQDNDTAPAFSIDDVIHNEGDSSTTSYTFTVTKSGNTALSSSVTYETVNGTATAPSDFTAIGPTVLTFGPADTMMQVTVLVNGDTTIEPNEAFTVHLSSPNNATISDADGTGTITNDDSASFAINDVTQAETNSGQTAFTFTVTKTGPAGASVDFQTQNGTATSGSDYVANNGTLTFGPTDTTMPVTVMVNGDTTPEPNETFTVHLSNATGGATISDADGTGTITNDDGGPATVYVNAAWAAVPCGQDPDGAGPATSMCFDAFATIQDGVNGVATNGPIHGGGKIPTIAGSTVIVAAGNYPGDVNVNESVILQGPQVGVNPDDVNWNDVRTNLANEAVIQGALNLSIQNTITVDGFTLNRSATNEGHILIGGGLPSGSHATTVLTIQNNRITGTRNTGPTWAGIHSNFLDNFPGPAFTLPGANATITHNRIEIGGSGSGDGILINRLVPGTDTNSSLSITGNYVASDPFNGSAISIIQTQTSNGVAQVTGNHLPGGEVAMFRTLGANIANNQMLTPAFDGVWLNGGDDNITVTNNTITNPPEEAIVVGDFGFSAPTPRPNSNLTISNNTITVDATQLDASGYGMFDIGGGLTGTNTISDNSLTITGALPGGVTEVYGMLVHNRNIGAGSDPQTVGSVSLTNNTFTGGGSLGGSSAGVKLDSNLTVATQVTLDGGNSISGFPIGVDAANGTATMKSNTIVTNATGVRFSNSAAGNAHFNRIVGNTTGLVANGGPIDAENNWWGCNAGPAAVGCDAVSGAVDFNPWIVLGASASPNPINPGGMTTVTADMTHNSDNLVPSATMFVPDVAVAFSATQGTMNPTSGTITSGQEDSTFTSTSNNDGTATATVDGQPATTVIDVTSPTFTINDVTQAETNSGQTMFVFTVTKNGSTPFTSTVDFMTQNGTATVADGDYQMTNGTLTFGPSDTTMPVTVLVNGDTKYEANETFTVELSNPTVAGEVITGSVVDSGTGTITNDDAAPSFAIDSVMHNEGNASTTSYVFTVTKSGSTGLSSSVNFTTQDGSATLADNDYQMNSGMLTFGPSDTMMQITVLVNGDTTVEPNEAFNVHLSGAVNASISSADGTGTITNDDAAVEFSINDVTQAETNSGQTAFIFTVTKAGNAGGSVDFQTQNGTATSGSDYVANNGTLTFGPTDTTMPVTVMVNGDTTPEPSETFTVHLSNASVGTAISDADGLGTITNDDGGPAIVYVDDSWVGTAPGADPDGAGPATSFGFDAFATIQDGVNGVATGGRVIVRDGTYTENVTIARAMGLEGAQFGVDARGRVAAESVVIPAASSTATFLVAFNGLISIDGFSFSGGPTGANGVIFTSAGPNNNMQIRNNRFSNYPSAAIWMNRGGSDITIDKNVLDGSSINTPNAQAIFGNGPQSYAGLFITNNNIINNTGRYGFFVDGNHNVGESATRAATIDGNLFNNNTQSLNLGSRSFGTLAAPVLGAYGGYITNNTFSNNTANGIQAGIQHVLVSGNTFSNNAIDGLALTSFGNTGADRGGQNSDIKSNYFTGNSHSGLFFSGTQGVGLIGTNHANFNRFVANAVAIQYGSSVNAGNNATIDVENNWYGCNFGPGAGGTGCSGTTNGNLVFAGNTGVLDANPWIVLAVSASPNPIAPGGMSTVTADMTHNSDNLVPSGTMFVPNEPVAFGATQGTIAPPTGTITNGQAMATFTSTSNSDGTASSTVDGQTVSTIIDVTSPTFTINDVTQAETNSGQTMFTFTVTKTGTTGLTSTVDFQTQNGTATVADNDYVANSGTLTFGPSDTTMPVTVLVNGDTKYENDETFTVELSNPTVAGETIAGGVVDSGTGTITNDDNPPSFSIDNVTQAETNSGQTMFVFTVTKSGSTGLSSSVNFTTQDGSATLADNDYQMNSGMLTFGPSDTMMQITVLVNGDTTFEPNETFNVHLSGAMNATISGADGTGTITNDDVAPPNIVYVDDDWSAVPPGTDPDGGGPATSMGFDAFATIQGGVNGVANPGTVIVHAGTYPEAVTVNKSLTINGAQVGQNANTRFAAFVAGPNGPKADPAVESILTAATTAPLSGANDTLHVMANNVIFNGFVVDGNNPALPQGGAVVVGGINTDSRTGIQTEDAAGNNFSATNVLIEHNIVQNFAGDNANNLGGGITLVNPTNASPATTGGLITGNVVRNFGAYGILLSNNAYGDVTFNTVDTPDYPTANAGIWVYDFPNNGVGPKTINIANNNVTVRQDNFGGIWINLVYAPAATININNNTVNAAAGVQPLDDFTYGIYLTSLLNGTATHLSANTVGSAGGTFDRGIALWNVGTSPTATVKDGTVKRSVDGISLVYNDANFGPAGASSAANVSGMTVTEAKVGVVVDATGSGANTVTMTVTNSTLSGNTATNGGGVSSTGTGGVASTTVTNSTLSGNSSSGASILLQDASLTVGNTIFNTGASGTNISALGTSVVSSRGYNLSSDNFGGFLTGAGDQVNTDPMLGPLKDNGGPTFTHAPLTNSPAIDQGKDIGPIAPAYAAIGKDQRGFTRPVNDPAIPNAVGGDGSDIGAVELVVGVHPSSASSRKTHGASGDFDISLPLSGPVGSECRGTGDPTNLYKMVLIFENPVTFSGAAVTNGTGTVDSVMTNSIVVEGVSGTQVTINLSGVTDVQTLTVGLFDVDDGVNKGDVGVRMHVMIGDVTANGVINSSDIGFVKAKIGHVIDGTTFRADVNANGAINASDVALVKSKEP